jgi:uncharacterized membrane protein YfcA
VTVALLTAACGLLVASILQSTTGFGFALIAGPVLYAVVEPLTAVVLVLALGQVVNLLVLFGEHRPLQINWTAIRPAILAAVPGLPIGALIIRTVPDAVMRVSVGLTVCAIVIARLVGHRTPDRTASVDHRGALVAGFVVGVLTTSTTTSGPPLAIWLTGRRMDPPAIRDAVTVIFFTLDFVGIAVLLVITGSDSLNHVVWIPALIPVAIAGHFAGRHLFLDLPPHHYTPLVLTTALAAGAIATATGIASM